MKESALLTSGVRLLSNEESSRAECAAWIRVVLVVLFVVLVLVRIPAVLLHGRFWAEEGVVYFHAAWTKPWSEALFTIHTGYLNIVASSATVLAAHAVPLAEAPLVTIGIALVFQALPAVVLATSRIHWLGRWPALAVALLCLLIPPGDAEVWLNSITSQFHLALCVGLILAADIRGGWIGRLRGAILVVAPLAGPVSGTLAPLFLLRAWLERSWPRLIQTILLGIPTFAQAVITLTHPEPARSIGIGLPLLLAVIGVQNVILPLAGLGLTQPLAAADLQSFAKGDVPVLVILAGALGIGALGFVLCRLGDRASLWLYAGGCTLAVCSYSFALTLGQPLNLLIWLGGRYVFAPAVLLSLSLLGLAVSTRFPARLLPIGLVVLLLHAGWIDYFHVPVFFAQGADWQHEVTAWRHDPTYKLRIWPHDWSMDLPPHRPAEPGK